LPYYPPSVEATEDENSMNQQSSIRIQLTDDSERMDLSDHVDFVQHNGAGGIATFSGTVRKSNEGRNVDFLVYETYEQMARKQLRELIEVARDRWSDRGELTFAVSHRTGKVPIGEPAVIVAVSAPHRAEALEACRFLIDRLKADVPIWKKEHFSDGEVWVENKDQLEQSQS